MDGTGPVRPAASPYPPGSGHAFVPQSAARGPVTPGAVPAPQPAAERDQINTEQPRRVQAGALSAAEQEQVRALRNRDREVRAHERAHLAAAGPHARGGARYTFETGPDGRSYAVAGEVRIDTTPVPDDPQATLIKAQQVRRAALAPAQPSPQDRRVAAEAAAMASRARNELARARAEEYPGNRVGEAPIIDLMA